MSGAKLKQMERRAHVVYKRWPAHSKPFIPHEGELPAVSSDLVLPPHEEEAC